MATTKKRSSLSHQHLSWGYACACSHLLHKKKWHQQFLNEARDILKKAKVGIKRIIKQLEKSGYEFAFPDEVFVKPDRSIVKQLAKLKAKKIHLPVSIQAWMLEIGQVNLMGTHPDWPKPAYLDDSGNSDHVWYTDPLVVTIDYNHVLYDHDNHLHTLNDPDPKSEYYEEGKPPFCLTFAPDYLHKASVSGGAPYSIEAERPP